MPPLRTDNHRTGTARIVLRSAPRIPPLPSTAGKCRPSARTTIALARPESFSGPHRGYRPYPARQENAAPPHGQPSHWHGPNRSPVRTADTALSGTAGKCRPICRDNHRTGTARIILRSAPRIPPLPSTAGKCRPSARTTIALARPESFSGPHCRYRPYPARQENAAPPHGQPSHWHGPNRSPVRTADTALTQHGRKMPPLRTDNHRTGTARIVLRSAPRIPPYPERQENAAPFAGTTIRRMSRYGSCPDTNLPENGNPASAGIYARSERGTKKGPIRHRSLSLFH